MKTRNVNWRALTEKEQSASAANNMQVEGQGVVVTLTEVDGYLNIRIDPAGEELARLDIWELTGHDMQAAISVRGVPTARSQHLKLVAARLSALRSAVLRSVITEDQKDALLDLLEETDE